MIKPLFSGFFVPVKKSKITGGIQPEAKPWRFDFTCQRVSNREKHEEKA